MNETVGVATVVAHESIPKEKLQSFSGDMLNKCRSNQGSYVVYCKTNIALYVG